MCQGAPGGANMHALVREGVEAGAAVIAAEPRCSDAAERQHFDRGLQDRPVDDQGAGPGRTQDLGLDPAIGGEQIDRQRRGHRANEPQRARQVGAVQQWQDRAENLFPEQT